MKNKQEQINELNSRIIKCSNCSLRANCKNVVPGEGFVETKIMFIGEAPGRKEDETGYPFVGAAGNFLNEMLALIEFKRENVYIANVVKCRPPENRDPLPEEIKACWSWLSEQIRIINPDLIVTLGRHSLERFLPGRKISQVHGKAMRRNIPGIGTRIFYALYHPAAALYNKKMRDVLIRDFKKIPRVLKAINECNTIATTNLNINREKSKQENLFNLDE